MIRWPIFAIPMVLAGTYCFLRLQDSPSPFDRADRDDGDLGAGARDRRVPADRGRPGFVVKIEPGAYLAQMRDLGPVREAVARPRSADRRLVTFPASMLLAVLSPGRSGRCGGCGRSRSFKGAMLASTPVDGGHYFIEISRPGSPLRRWPSWRRAGQRSRRRPPGRGHGDCTFGRARGDARRVIVAVRSQVVAQETTPGAIRPLAAPVRRPARAAPPAPERARHRTPGARCPRSCPIRSTHSPTM